jgi:hypothetical protein
MSARELCAAQQAADGFVAITPSGILTGDHPFVDVMAKLAVNVINCVDGSVKVSIFFRCVFIEPAEFERQRCTEAVRQRRALLAHGVVSAAPTS